MCISQLLPPNKPLQNLAPQNNHHLLNSWFCGLAVQTGFPMRGGLMSSAGLPQHLQVSWLAQTLGLAEYQLGQQEAWATSLSSSWVSLGSLVLRWQGLLVSRCGSGTEPALLHSQAIPDPKDGEADIILMGGVSKAHHSGQRVDTGRGKIDALIAIHLLHMAEKRKVRQIPGASSEKSFSLPSVKPFTSCKALFCSRLNLLLPMTLCYLPFSAVA